MIFIAHRGNTIGPNRVDENKPGYIQKALDDGYHVEVDVWLTNDLFLGHDSPEHITTLEFLKSDDRMIFHAKNTKALLFLVEHGLHCFSHDQDDVVLTSNKWLWTFPGKTLTPSSVAVMPENAANWDISSSYAICSDYVESLKASFV
jgi:hypothetical protein